MGIEDSRIIGDSERGIQLRAEQRGCVRLLRFIAQHSMNVIDNADRYKLLHCTLVP